MTYLNRCLSDCLFFTGLVLFILFFPLPASAYKILFYFNSQDGTDGALLQAVTILQNAGNYVTAIDVNGRNRNPENDNWGPPYDQVWDMRFIDRQASQCGSGNPKAADYFDENWRSKSVSFLNHCGKIFVAGEHYLLPDRDEGLYAFLKEIQAVKNGFESCPPSVRGNSSTEGEAFYRVRHGLGPVSFYGAWVGGIPIAYLSGTNYVDTAEDWEDDEVDRSIVSGWEGAQLGGAVTAGFCGRGKLFVVWDATMWTLWQPGIYEEEDRGSPVWDDSAWMPGNIQSPASSIMRIKEAKEVTSEFFPAVAKWLGEKGCPCTETYQAPVFPATEAPIRKVTNPNYILPNVQSPSTPAGSLLNALNRSSTVTVYFPSNSPATVEFSDFPVNVYMGFRDGVGNYQLSILDSQGRLVQIIFNKNITTEKESWAGWNGNDLAGKESPAGLYYSVLTKDGRFLRKLVLLRITPHK
jgi:hypothetical protein